VSQIDPGQVVDLPHGQRFISRSSEPHRPDILSDGRA
jgi:hypothetical protein